MYDTIEYSGGWINTPVCNPLLGLYFRNLQKYDPSIIINSNHSIARERSTTWEERRERGEQGGEESTC